MDTPRDIYSTLKRLCGTIKQGERRFLETQELGERQFTALQNIAASPGLSLTRLGRQTCTDKSTTTRVVRGLESDELVARQPSPTDGRAFRLYLTETGVERMEAIEEAFDAYLLKWMDYDESARHDIVPELVQLESVLQIQRDASTDTS